MRTTKIRSLRNWEAEHMLVGKLSIGHKFGSAIVRVESSSLRTSDGWRRAQIEYALWQGADSLFYGGI